MADTTTSTIQLSTLLAPELQKAFNRETTLAQILEVRTGDNPGGPKWVVNKGGSTASTHAEGSAINSFSSDSDEAATLSWGLYEQPFKITDEALSRAKASPSPRATQNLFQRELSQSVQALAKQFEVDSFSGSGSNSVIGLDTSIDDANTYAGIDRSSNAFFRSHVADPGALTSLTKSQIVADLAEIKKDSGERPNLAVCDPLVFAAVENIFETQRRFIGPETALGTGGMPVIDVFGTRFIEAVDGYAADNNGTIYYLNTDYVHIEAMPYLEGDIFDAMSVSGDSLVNYMNFKKVPFAGHATAGVVRVQAQLVVENPLKCGKRVNIDIS